MTGRPFLITAVGLVALTAGAAAVAQEDATPMRATPIMRERAEELRIRARLQGRELKATVNAAAVKPTTVYVDCNKNQSIAKALTNTAAALVIQITGVCQENFQVRRSNVTFRGSNPDLDGIQGVVADPQPDAAVELYKAENIRFENLKVEDSPSNGMAAWDSHVEFANCQFLGNGNVGLLMSESSVTEAATDLTFSGNFRGLRVDGNAWFKCTTCTFADNEFTGAFVPYWATFLCDHCTFAGNKACGVDSESASYVDLTNSTVTAAYEAGEIYGYGVCASWAGAVYMLDSTISAEADPGYQQLAVWSGRSGIVDLREVTVNGPIQAQQNSLIYLQGVTQKSGLWTSIELNSLLDVRQSRRRLPGSTSKVTPSTLGPTYVSTFGKAVLRDATMVAGSFGCGEGGDAWASDDAVVQGGVSGCDHWTYEPPPSP